MTRAQRIEDEAVALVGAVSMMLRAMGHDEAAVAEVLGGMRAALTQPEDTPAVDEGLALAIAEAVRYAALDVAEERIGDGQWRERFKSELMRMSLMAIIRRCITERGGK